ncbi:MAG: DUF1304 domain-containing protein [Vulcanimicrobiaceae bacterium]
MRTVSLILLGIVAIEHLYFLYLEMFAWTRPRTMQAFGITPAFARESKSLAANQGLYNGFLAAGLIWAILAPPALQEPLAIFFTTCVLVAAAYGGITVTRRILILQGTPAAFALLATLAWLHS